MTWMRIWPAKEILLHKMVEKGKGHKCLLTIDRADKVIHGSNEALANSMPQSHPWVKFITH